MQSTRGIPSLKIDIAYPEALTDQSLELIDIGQGCKLKAYSLERITGEKHRAFLSTLPSYFIKMGKIPRPVRAKDLYDIAKISKVKKIEDEKFWLAAGHEFHLACKSRYIDCDGINTFAENYNVTESTYNNDPTIPKDIPFLSAWESLKQIVIFWELNKIIPLLR